MTKFRIICKECNKIAATVESNVAPSTDPVCQFCGAQKMSVEAVQLMNEYESIEFDVFITNKRNAFSAHQGFVLKGESINKDALYEQVADAMVTILKKPEALNNLLQKKEM